MSEHHWEHAVREGDLLVERLVTDTRGYYVTRATAKSIWVIPAHETAIRLRDGGPGDFPVVYTAIEKPLEYRGEPVRVGLTKKGRFHYKGNRNALVPAPKREFPEEGELPYTLTDYSF